MTTGWSLFVIILTVLNIAACFWLLRWTSKPRSANEKIGGGADTGHVWDKDLREYNNPLPKWWLWLFYITIAFGVLYLALFPGLGNFAGMKGWTQSGQYEQERDAVEARAAQLLAPLAALPVAELVNNEQAMSTAHNLFQQNCAQCHGSDGGGAAGFPNLANADWQWGSDADSVVATIARAASRRCRRGARCSARRAWMKWWPTCRRSVASRPTRRSRPPARRASRQVCAACHGMDGKGNPMLGAPNLTDGVWLYGGDAATLKQTVVQGRNGQMPAWGDKLGEQRVKLLAAYVDEAGRGG